MKHKLASLLTAFMMLSAVTLITGCNQLQGSKKSVNKVSKTDLQGVWNVNNAAGQYMMHLYFDGSTVYAAVKSGNQFVRYTQTITYNENGNTISVAGTNYTPVKNGNGIDLQRNGVTALKMTKDSSVAGDTIKNALSTPSTPGTNPGANPGNSGNIASKADLQGVWKVSTVTDQYTMHMYIEGATVYAATQVSPGQFVKFPQNITYNSDGTLSAGGQALTPVKNGSGIDLQRNGVTALKMTKDSSVAGDTIKNALSTPSTPGTNPGTNPGTHPGTNPGNSGNIASKADLQGVWKVSGGSEYAMHMYIEGATVYAATQVSPGQFVKFPQNITYNSDGTLSAGGYALTPVKKGEAIELQFNGVTDLTMTKDASVTADSIKNAQ